MGTPSKAKSSYSGSSPKNSSSSDNLAPAFVSQDSPIPSPSSRARALSSITRPWRSTSSSSSKMTDGSSPKAGNAGTGGKSSSPAVQKNELLYPSLPSPSAAPASTSKMAAKSQSLSSKEKEARRQRMAREEEEIINNLARFGLVNIQPSSPSFTPANRMSKGAVEADRAEVKSGSTNATTVTPTQRRRPRAYTDGKVPPRLHDLAERTSDGQRDSPASWRRYPSTKVVDSSADSNFPVSRSFNTDTALVLAATAAATAKSSGGVGAGNARIPHASLQQSPTRARNWPYSSAASNTMMPYPTQSASSRSLVFIPGTGQDDRRASLYSHSSSSSSRTSGVGSAAESSHRADHAAAALHRYEYSSSSALGTPTSPLSLGMNSLSSHSSRSSHEECICLRDSSSMCYDEEEVLSSMIDASSTIIGGSGDGGGLGGGAGNISDSGLDMESTCALPSSWGNASSPQIRSRTSPAEAYHARFTSPLMDSSSLRDPPVSAPLGRTFDRTMPVPTQQHVSPLASPITAPRRRSTRASRRPTTADNPHSTLDARWKEALDVATVTAQAHREMLQMLQPPPTGLPAKDFETRVTRLTECLVALQRTESGSRRPTSSIAGITAARDNDPDTISTLRMVETIEADLQNVLSLQIEAGCLEKATVEDIRLLEVFTQTRLRLGLPALSLFRLFSRSRAAPSSLVGLLNSRSPRSPLLAASEDDARTPAPSTPLAPPPRRKRRPRTADSQLGPDCQSSTPAYIAHAHGLLGSRNDHQLRLTPHDSPQPQRQGDTPSKPASSAKFGESYPRNHSSADTASLFSVTTQNTINSFQCAGPGSELGHGIENDHEFCPRDSPSDDILTPLDLHLDISSALHAKRKQQLAEAV